MKRFAIWPVPVFSILLALLVGAQQPPVPSIQPTAEETRRIQSKIDELDGMVRNLKARRADDDLLADIEIYAKAGRMLLEFPEDFFTQQGIDHTLTVLDTGMERARELQNGKSPWIAAAKDSWLPLRSRWLGSAIRLENSRFVRRQSAGPALRLDARARGEAHRSGFSIFVSKSSGFEAARR